MIKNIRKSISIAGISIRVESNVNFEFSEKCSKFISGDEIADVTFLFRWETDIEINGEILFDFDKYRFVKKGERIYCLCKKYHDNDAYIWCVSRIEAESKYEVIVLDDIDDEIPIINPLIYVELASFLIKFNAIILHSSLIKFNNKAIIFTAPSQTGKSTQASIWEKYYGAEIINGDRSILRYLNNKWIAAGSPYAGSSGIYKNECAEIRAIVVLRQAKQNEIHRMSMKESYMCLLSEITISPIDKKTVEVQSEWILKLIEDVPIYKLSCLPNKSAADILYKELKEQF